MFWISNCVLQSLCPAVRCGGIHIYKQCSSASSSERGRQCHIYVRNIFVSSPKWGLRLSLSNHTSRVTQIVQARHPVLFYAHTKTLCIGWDVIVQYTQIPIPLDSHTTQAEPPLVTRLLATSSSPSNYTSNYYDCRSHLPDLLLFTKTVLTAVDNNLKHTKTPEHTGHTHSVTSAHTPRCVLILLCLKKEMYAIISEVQRSSCLISAAP